MAKTLGAEDLAPEITGKYRVGDIRHCFADIALARDVLGYAPEVSLEEGLAELVAWLTTQRALDRVQAASEELARRGLSL
jgi:dTDP-L-rhamnose 4-epimerase